MQHRAYIGSIHPEVFYKMPVMKSLAKFTTPAMASFLVKYRPVPLSLVEKDCHRRRFHVDFDNFYKTAILQNTYELRLLVVLP